MTDCASLQDYVVCPVCENKIKKFETRQSVSGLCPHCGSKVRHRIKNRPDGEKDNNSHPRNNVQGYPQSTELKFDEEFIEPILAGRKTATIRYEIESHDALRIGRKFQLVDEDGERFASAIVDDRGYQTAQWIVENGIKGHNDYCDLKEFYAQMREYYPQAELGPQTCFEIIYWQSKELWQ